MSQPNLLWWAAFFAGNNTWKSSMSNDRGLINGKFFVTHSKYQCETIGEGILVKHLNVHSHAPLRVHTMEVNCSSLPVSNGASGLALFPGLPTVRHIWGLLLQHHKLDSGKAWEWDCWTENESNHFNEPMLMQETPPTYGQRGLGVNL